MNKALRLTLGVIGTLVVIWAFGLLIFTVKKVF